MNVVQIMDRGLPGYIVSLGKSDPNGPSIGKGDVDSDALGVDADFPARGGVGQGELRFSDDVMCGHEG